MPELPEPENRTLSEIRRDNAIKYFSDPANRKKHSDILKQLYIDRPEMHEIRSGVNNGNYGKKLSEEQKKKIGEFHSTFQHTEETKKKMSETRKGRTTHMKGKQHSIVTKAKISVALKGRVVSAETRLKKHFATCGEKAYCWKGGVSFEPYCVKFDRAFKKRVRDFFNNTCPQCGKHNLKYKLHVHHVNFNKQTCCDNTISLFVPLCNGCHGKTQHNRIFWQYWFTEMINHIYDRKCYFEKDEVY